MKFVVNNIYIYIFHCFREFVHENLSEILIDSYRGINERTIVDSTLGKNLFQKFQSGIVASFLVATTIELTRITRSSGKISVTIAQKNALHNSIP